MSCRRVIPHPLPQLRTWGYPHDCMRDYQRGYLGLSAEQSERTFNAGVLVIDIARYAARLEAVLEELMARDYAYAYQDILNLAFAYDHLLLPLVLAGDGRHAVLCNGPAALGACLRQQAAAQLLPPGVPPPGVISPAPETAAAPPSRAQRR